MDACMGYLREVDLLMEEYTDLSTYQDLFEAADDAVAKAIDKNDKITGKSESLLSKAIGAVKALIRKIKSMLSGIMEYFTASKGEREDFEAFCKRIKSDPSMAGKKVTIHDYREIMKQYDKVLGNAEKEYKAMKDEEVEQRETIGGVVQKELNSLKQKTMDIAKASGTFVTVEVAMEYARSCRGNAKKLRSIIAHDEELLDRLEKELGKKGVKRMKRDIKILSSRCGILRRILGGRHQQAYTLSDAVKDVMSSASNKSYATSEASAATRLANDARKYAGKSKAGEAVKSVAKTSAEIGRKSYLESRKIKNNVNKETKAIDRDFVDARIASDKNDKRKVKQIASKYMDTYNKKGWKVKEEEEE